MDNIDYKQKYLKYKIKYNNLVKQIGGDYSGHVWAYDFDGVVHKWMMRGENYQTNHRNPWHKGLARFEKDHTILRKYLFNHTIEDMRIGQSKGAKIIIVSANSHKFRNSIHKLLNELGIQINITDVHMGINPKVNALKILKVNRFVDDSCANIRDVYNSFTNFELMDLNQLIFSVPETETYYNIDLSKPITICNSPRFSLGGLVTLKPGQYKSEGFCESAIECLTSFFKSDSHTFSPISPLPVTSARAIISQPRVHHKKTNSITLLSYNIDFHNYNKSPNSDNISRYILKNLCDINSLQEASWGNERFIRKLPRNFHVIEKNPGNFKYTTKLIFDSNKFTLIDNINIAYSRGIVCCRLKHNISKQMFIIICVHLEHWHDSSLKGNNSSKETIKLLSKILTDAKYSKGDTILLLGDCNELHSKMLKLSQTIKLKIRGQDINLKFNTGDKPSCCSNSGGPFKFYSDLIASNKNNFNYIITDDRARKEHSDHLPLKAEFNF